MAFVSFVDLSSAEGFVDHVLAALSVRARPVEQAGGAANNGERRILELQPTSLHERVAVVLGSREEVERVAAYHREPV